MTNYDAAFAQSRARLQALSPAAISAACAGQFDEQTGCFSITSLGREIHISYPTGVVTFAGTTEYLPFDWSLILLNHLSTARPVPPVGEWFSYGSLPQGRFFAANIRATVLQPLARFYSACDPARLRRSLARLGFLDAPMSADLSAIGTFAPRVPIALQFWNGEDDLPPSCQLLFDQTITIQMHIEDTAALCGVIRKQVLDSYALLAD